MGSSASPRKVRGRKNKTQYQKYSEIRKSELTYLNRSMDCLSNYSYRSRELLCRKQAALASNLATRRELEHMALEYGRRPISRSGRRIDKYEVARRRQRDAGGCWRSCALTTDSARSANRCSVTKFQQCWEIYSNLIRNTVAPIAVRCEPGSCSVNEII
jgi:hypothetical protein